MAAVGCASCQERAHTSLSVCQQLAFPPFPHSMWFAPSCDLSLNIFQDLGKLLTTYNTCVAGAFVRVGNQTAFFSLLMWARSCVFFVSYGLGFWLVGGFGGLEKPVRNVLWFVFCKRESLGLSRDIERRMRYIRGVISPIIPLSSCSHHIGFLLET